MPPARAASAPQTATNRARHYGKELIVGRCCCYWWITITLKRSGKIYKRKPNMNLKNAKPAHLYVIIVKKQRQDNPVYLVTVF